MRVVESPDAFLEAAESAAREAQNAFGDPRLMLERYLARPRHIEVQILADQHGRVIHLHERECSIQRRHQKIIEESPSPALSPETRAAICDAAVRLAETVGYTNAGTVEFLYEATPDGERFYFLEVNTRLQVEHPVTEMVTGVDLVHWQIRIAAGEPLTLETPPPRGHAIEARLYAEDPDNDFAPALGTLLAYALPHLPGVRVDSGVEAGAVITPHYDPMIAKVIAHAPDRPAAIRRLVNALEQTVALGVRTNQAFLIDLLQHPAFQAGDLHTGFLIEHRVSRGADTLPEPVLTALALLEPLARAMPPRAAAPDGLARAPSPWEQLGRWRIGK
jgi:acetyl/propionyl-CoA carboxylase alpha subunit